MPETCLIPTQDEIQNSTLYQFIQYVKDHGFEGETYDELHHWSLQDPVQFWPAVASFCQIELDRPAQHIYLETPNPPYARWFEGAELNFADQCLKHPEHHIALIFESVQMSYGELKSSVSAMADFLITQGCVAGDVVAGVMSNTPETVILALASATLGCPWVSCPPEFGHRAILSRLIPTAPKILCITQQHRYRKQVFEHEGLVKICRTALPSVNCIILHTLNQDLHGANISFNRILQQHRGASFKPISVLFSHPLYILFTSGTTGAPKCIVHGTGGTLLQHVKELAIHTDIKAQTKLGYYTSTGWMMWHWQLSALALGATIALYDQDPSYPEQDQLLRWAAETELEVLGISAAYIDQLHTHKIEIGLRHDLKKLQMILSTGSPLSPQNFKYIYSKLSPRIRLYSISGGTDIISCFALGNAMKPVIAGEISCLGLGMAVEVWNEGQAAPVGTLGQLVCVKPAISMPIQLLNDDGRLYKKTYYHATEGVWFHGDLAILTAQKSLRILGRSDTLLNAKGIRIGPAELYEVLLSIEGIQEAAVVDHQMGDEQTCMVCFLVMMSGWTLNSEHISHIKQVITRELSPHHTPAVMIQAPALPKTRSGKLSEMSIRKAIQGKSLSNLESLKNPETIQFFHDWGEKHRLG